ncbi:MAG: tetratricopeptide repeat protein [Thermoanaerobaculia bacterium]|nr:tetratricopeptide repeat protein [Thermoanaerobaculia bacterium]
MSGRHLLLATFLVVSLVAPADRPAGAQTGSSQSATEEAAAFQADPDAMLSDAGMEAFKLLQTGDASGALARLEAAHAAGESTLVDRSMMSSLYLENGRAQEAYDVVAEAASESSDPALLYNAGRAALAVGQGEQGVAWLERSANAVPASPAGRTLGMIRAQQMRCSESLQRLRPWLRSEPTDREARLVAAMCSLELKRPRDAEALLLGLPTSEPRVGVLRAQLLIQQSDPISALVILEPLLENHPPEMRADVIRLTGEAYLNSGRAAEAVELLSGLETRGPRLTLLHSEALYRTGNLDGALAELKPIAEAALGKEITHPLISQAISDYGRILVASGRSDQALPYLERATQLLPERIETWKSYGEALTASGRRDEARQALETFRKLQQRQTEQRRAAESAAQDPVAATLTKARNEAVAGDYDAALRSLRQEMAISPDDIRSHLLYVQILLAAQRVDEARSAAEETLVEFPRNVDAAYQLGAVKMTAGDEAAAEESFRQALALDPQHVASLNDLAVLLATRGQTGEALSLAERLVSLKPDDAQAQKLLAAISAETSGS